ncbi:MAG: hypothetical protein F4X44_10315 [Gammaproteobacteria bacterium]|nr:hypothetical protein [Gammaproteobacteria bacterium]MYD80991.1 hypothetical protein [Gammaproteobacteria bacterium]
MSKLIEKIGSSVVISDDCLSEGKIHCFVRSFTFNSGKVDYIDIRVGLASAGQFVDMLADSDSVELEVGSKVKFGANLVKPYSNNIADRTYRADAMSFHLNEGSADQFVDVRFFETK